jgi:hypothetical protein
VEFVVAVHGNAVLVMWVLLGNFCSFILGSGNAAVKEFVVLLLEQSKHVLDMALGVGSMVGGFGFVVGLVVNFVCNGLGWARAIKLGAGREDRISIIC